MGRIRKQYRDSLAHIVEIKDIIFAGCLELIYIFCIRSFKYVYFSPI